MKVGDLVILREGRYKFAPAAAGGHAGARWIWTDVIGIITDDRGFIDGTEEYRVFTINGKDTWSHVNDLRLVEKP